MNINVLLKVIFQKILGGKACFMSLLISFLKRGEGEEEKGCKLIQTNISFGWWNFIVFPFKTFLFTSMHYNPQRIYAVGHKEAISHMSGNTQTL